ncbi:hypothetical protein WG908_07210 [Sphingobium sp. AN641]|uniref:hypothetical protein n=1 Tax=Sphingobium sp. AN641 TaxID=3133443 RepID=UPI0030BD4AEA
MPASGQTRADERLVFLPYVGIDQVVTAPIRGGGDVLTYTNLSAGFTAEVNNRRVEALADVQYNHSFGWGGQAPDQDVLSGIVNARYHVARGLSLEAGGFATRIRSDGLSGATPLNDSYTSQVYSGYVGPSYTTKVGVLDVSASYRLGYTRVEDDVSVALPGAPSGGSYDDALSHILTGSVGFSPGTLLPVGLVASGGYVREDPSQLDQRFEDVWGRVDATLPVTPTVALVGGIGYEEISISQRSPLLAGNGTPLIVNGRYVTDESSPRALIYDQDGLIWDAGVLWRPSRRTALEARVGERYGGMTYQGSFTWQGRDSSFGVAVFDGIDSFGRVINANVAALSGNLDVVRNPFTGNITGCAFSTTGGGQCFNDGLSGITDANFRYRGVAAQYSRRRGPWGWGLGAGYSQRKFITPRTDAVIIRGSSDENWYGNGSVTYTINDNSSLESVVYVNYFDASGGRTDTLNYGGFTSYYRGITRRLSASASVGVDGVKADDIDTIISAMGQLGLRYSF